MNNPTTIRDLHLDVLLYVFDYFTVEEIYEIFSQIIPNLTWLLINSRIRLHLRQSINIQVDPAQIISIKLKSLPRISSPTIGEFINLRSLILNDQEDPTLLITEPLAQSLEILDLNISLRNKPTIIPPLLERLTQLPNLRSVKIIYSSSYFILQPELLNLSNVSTTLKFVQLNIKCSINFLEQLFKCLPALQRIETLVVSNIEDSSNAEHELLFPNVENIIFTWDYIPLMDMITFCKKMPNLKECMFISNDHQYDPTVFNPSVWRDFIESDHVNLQKLNVKMKPIPHMQRGRPRFPSQKDPYFRLINFQFENNEWDETVLEGHYMRV